MSRVFWDSMLFIYLLEGKPDYYERADYLLQRSVERGDRLFTSFLVVGELLVPSSRSLHPDKAAIVRSTIDQLGFTYLPFDNNAVSTFANLRAKSGLSVPDSINLACAAAVGMDLFLTNDKQLTSRNVPGIQFIAGFKTDLL